MKPTDVKDQKVFITLRSVTDLQKEYIRICDIVKTDREHNDTNPLLAARARGLEFAIKTLGLPIDIYH